MATKHIMVEVNFTSNDVILDIKGDSHPFMLYRKYGVPVALSTDDKGISRIDLTHEYVHAAVTYRLNYLDFKLMARTSIEHSFLPGGSLWQLSTPESLDQSVVSCRGQLGRETPTGACLRSFPISHTQHQAPQNNTVSEWGTRHLHQSQTHHAKVTTVVVCQTQGSGSMTIKC